MAFHSGRRQVDSSSQAAWTGHRGEEFVLFCDFFLTELPANAFLTTKALW
jgi:hypothetical protein